HLPMQHVLESWGDARAFDGTVSLQQPLILPMYQGRSLLEVLASLNGVSSPDGNALVMANWKSHAPGAAFGSFWSKALRDGVIPGTAEPTVTPGPGRAPAIAPPAASGLALVLRPDPYLHAGRLSNNGWLQELPRPITKLTWDNAALVSPATAQRLGLEDEALVALTYRGHTVTAPVLIQPGHADDCVSLAFGYGRTGVGHVADDVGVNAYTLRTLDAPYGGPGLTLKRVSGRHPLAVTRAHHLMDGRDLVREATLAEYQADPHFAHAHDRPIFSVLPEWEYERPKWAMAIDTSLCIGCNACVAACQSENNIPVVGKEQVLDGREMHWLRIDHYYEGTLDSPSHAFMPVPCMQCEDAPCELVCPTGATVHSNQGLNDMVYNRCVGTRYCSNNCPYKVRRFNFLQFADMQTPSVQLAYNPDVTVRERGVMEKCTYCVQRINAANHVSDATGEPIRDGMVRTACQAACPTHAIVFGDAGDPAAQVTARKADARNYALMEDLNTRPRTTYLARVRNPNPALES
ncbi:MAG TPA: 4Fe-4S dicluster domain-containing protein, partial [Oscillatoriaceae cyanobacterium]